MPQSAVAPNRKPGAAKPARQVLRDRQSERDHRELDIDKVGVRNLRFPIQVRDRAHAV
jgi:GTP cyclohydrolase FolE2